MVGGFLVSWLVGGFLVGWLVGWLVGLVGWLVGWLVGFWLVGWLGAGHVFCFENSQTFKNPGPIHGTNRHIYRSMTGCFVWKINR